MVKLSIKCSCGEAFDYEIDLERFMQELNTRGVIPLIIPHEDHFVTAYVDRQSRIRSVEQVILVDKEQQVAVADSQDLDRNEIIKILLEIKQDADPNKNYFNFISALVKRITSPEALFTAGEQTGYEMWMKMREAILKMGATYQPDINLLLRSEIKPILDKAGNTRLDNQNNVLEVTNCIAPQFVVGLAQGALVAIGESAEEKMEIKIEYLLGSNMVNLTLRV